MSDMERFIKSLRENGLDPIIGERTIQWTNPNWSVVAWFDENGKFLGQTRVE